MRLPAYGHPGTVHNFVAPSMGSNGAVSMTPGMSTRDLPGSGAPALSNVGARSGVSIYGPPATPATPWGHSSGPVTPGPLPPSALNPEEEEDEENDLDPQTVHNTRLNAVIGRAEGGYGQQAPGGRVVVSVEIMAGGKGMCQFVLCKCFDFQFCGFMFCIADYLQFAICTPNCSQTLIDFCPKCSGQIFSCIKLITLSIYK